MAVGAVIGKRNMAKHFAIEIADTTFAFARKTAAIAAEAALDGLYAVAPACPPRPSTTAPRSKATSPSPWSSTRSVR